MPPQKPFKVLIVGAGVTGLTLAHCLTKANIAFVLLDKGVIAPAFGNTITVFPHGIRIMHQLDCLNAVINQCAPMGASNCRWRDGNVFAACEKYFGVMKALTGYDARTIGRQEFLRLLPLEEKQSIRTAFSAMIGLSTPVPVLERCEAVINASHNKISFLIICQPKWVSWQVFIRLPKHQECSLPDGKKSTEEDMQALVDKIADYPITAAANFRQLWKGRLRAQMISLEEGVLEHWLFGRAVMAGDALHKVTLNSGLGASTAMEDAVSIANAIHQLTATRPNRKPTDDEIHDVLQQYQDTHIGRVKKIPMVGREMTRKQAYDGWWNYFRYRWLLPVIGMRYIAQVTAKLCVCAPKLTYVEFDEQNGLLSWRDMRLGGRGSKNSEVGKSRSMWHSTHYIKLLGWVITIFIAWYLAVIAKK
ncbi:hypothetical protein DL767_010307 [Monosporascus sp. MG133]|nr:hypothetical protein DL767_010307 [Monosporascus sp. MG133]